VLSMKRHHGSGASGSAEAPGRGTEIDESLCQCPVCLEVMFGKIFMCPEGHGICAESCFRTLPAPRKCPQCRKAYGASPCRGIMVEQMIGALQWSCKHGCGLKCSGAQLAAHHVVCPARPMKCPICLDLVAPSNLLQHFNDKGHEMTNTGKLSDDVCQVSGRWNYKGYCRQAKGSSLAVCLQGWGADDLFFLRIRHCEDQPSVMITAFHGRSPHHCRVTFGNSTETCMTFRIASRPWHEYQSGRFKAAESGTGLTFCADSAGLLCGSDGEVKLSLEVLR